MRLSYLIRTLHWTIAVKIPRESHIELHSKLDAIKIGYVGRELGGRAAAWWCGIMIAKKLPTTWEGFVDVFKK